MKSERLFLVLVTILGGIVTLILFTAILDQNIREVITKVNAENIWLIPLILFIYKFIAIIIPPIPGGWIGIVSVPFIGWFWVFIIDYIAELLGSIIAFLLARRYKQSLVTRFISLDKLVKWESTLSSYTKVWSFLVLRLTSSIALDYVSYVAGLTSISTSTYIAVTAVGYFIQGATFYYLISLGYEVSPVYFFFLGVLVLLVVFSYRKLLHRINSKK